MVKLSRSATKNIGPLFFKAHKSNGSAAVTSVFSIKNKLCKLFAPDRRWRSLHQSRMAKTPNHLVISMCFIDDLFAAHGIGVCFAIDHGLILGATSHLRRQNFSIVSDFFAEISCPLSNHRSS